MTLEEKMDQSEARVFKAVFPNTTNHYDTLFGGAALQMMDEVAFIAATRFCRQKLVTVSSGEVDFTEPIPSGTFMELIGRVVSVGKTSLTAEVSIYCEPMYSEERKLAVKGSFTLVAIDDNKQPVRVSRPDD